MGDVRAVVVQRAPGRPGRGESAQTTVLESADGCPNLVQRVLSVGPAGAATMRAEGGGECWYVSRGRAIVHADRSVGVEKPTGIFLPAGTSCQVENPGDEVLEVTIAVLPEPVACSEMLVAALEDCAVEVTGDRQFRVLLGAPQGFEAATQFVGDIPPGRAPEHSHTYDEVVRVLDGSGQIHAGGVVHPLEPGTSVYLPPGTPHCLENTSSGVLRVLGVFHPGGSPGAKSQHAGDGGGLAH